MSFTDLVAVLLFLVFIGIVGSSIYVISNAEEIEEEQLKNKKKNLKEKVVSKVKEPEIVELIDKLNIDNIEVIQTIPETNELGKKEGWGKLITAFSDRDKPDLMPPEDSKIKIYVFEEGIYISKHKGNKNQFASKDKVQIYEVLDDEIKIIIIVNEKPVFETYRNLIESSMNDLLDWYGSLEENQNLVDNYNIFTKHIEEISNEYLLYTYPYSLTELSYGEFIIKEFPFLVLGKNISDKSLLIEYRYKLTEEPIVIKIPYSSISSIQKEGAIENKTDMQTEGYFTEEEWDGKRIAAGYFLAGPIGSALVGKKKSKLVPPTFSTITRDNRSLNILIKKTDNIIFKIGNFKRTLDYDMDKIEHSHYMDNLEIDDMLGWLNYDKHIIGRSTIGKLIDEGAIKHEYKYINGVFYSEINGGHQITRESVYFNTKEMPIKLNAYKNNKIVIHKDKITFPYDVVYSFIKEYYSEKISSYEEL